MGNKLENDLKKGAKIHTAFDDYILIKQIGAGGNGRVFEAADSEEEKVAVKFVEKSISSFKLKRFKNEIYFCEHHSHANIVPIIDRGYASFDEKEYAFYVMPLYGETLKDRMKAGITPEVAADIFVGIIQGLKAAHEGGAIHRDIKPENILFEENSNVPVICDFGIAHFAEEHLLTAVETKISDRMANFQYSAPEQRIKGGKASPQTDIYAAALILNEMFTGEIPQAAGYRRISDVNSEYKYLDDLFDQMFQQEASKRLYPEEKILTELKLLADQNRREKEKAKLQSVIAQMKDPGEFSAKIVALEYKNPNLILVFNENLPNDWVITLRDGQYNHSALMGYETYRLSKIGSNKLGIPIQADDERTIKLVVGYIKKWVEEVNRLYTRELKNRAFNMQQEEERTRLAEINRLDKESRISKIISDLS